MAKTFTLEEMGMKLKQANPGKFDAYSNKQLANYYLEAKPQASSIVLQEGKAEGVAKGLGKSVLGTVKSAAGLGEKFLGSALKTVLPKSIEQKIGIDETTPTLFGQGANAQTSAESLQQKAETALDVVPGSLTEAKTGAQKFGKFAGDVGQFLLPGGVATKAGKVAEAAAATKGLGKVSQFGAKIAPQVASDVGVATLQTGSPVEGLKAGAVSGAFPAVGAGIKKATAPIVEAMQNTLPKRLVQSAVGQSKKDLLAGKDVSEYVLKNKKLGTANKMIADAQKAINSLEETISSNLKSVPVTQNKVTVKSVIKQIVDDINASGGAITEPEVKDIIVKLSQQAKGLLQKPSMGIRTANDLRRSIDRTLGDRAFLGSQLPFNKDVLKKFSNALREEVKNKAPEGTRELFKEYSSEITLRDALMNKYTGKAGNDLVRMRDLIGGAVGGAAFGGIIPAAVGIGATRAAQSPSVLIGTAKALQNLPPIIQKALEKLEPAERAAILEIIQKDD